MRAAAGFEYAVYFLPRRTIACERIFQEEGVYGDIVAGEFPLGFIPFDYDLLSLELGTAYRVRTQVAVVFIPISAAGAYTASEGSVCWTPAYTAAWTPASSPRVNILQFQRLCTRSGHVRL